MLTVNKLELNPEILSTFLLKNSALFSLALKQLIAIILKYSTLLNQNHSIKFVNYIVLFREMCINYYYQLRLVCFVCFLLKLHLFAVPTTRSKFVLYKGYFVVPSQPYVKCIPISSLCLCWSVRLQRSLRLFEQQVGVINSYLYC